MLGKVFELNISMNIVTLQISVKYMKFNKFTSNEEYSICPNVYKQLLIKLFQ